MCKEQRQRGQDGGTGGMAAGGGGGTIFLPDKVSSGGTTQGRVAQRKRDQEQGKVQPHCCSLGTG